MKNNIILLIGMLFILLSCKDRITIKTDNYPSGKVKYKYYYDKKGKLDSVHELYENSQKIKVRITNISDHKQYIEYLVGKKGEYKMSGWGLVNKEKDTILKNGWWNQVSDKLNAKMQYITIGDTTRINQVYKYNKDSSIDKEDSHYYEFRNLPDTVEINKTYIFNIDLISPILGNKDLYMSLLRLSDSITPDFSNFWLSKRTYDIKELETNKWEISKKFEKKGDYPIRGFIFKSVTEFEDINDDLINMSESRGITYIDKKIYVK